MLSAHMTELPVMAIRSTFKGVAGLWAQLSLRNAIIILLDLRLATDFCRHASASDV